MFDITHIRIWLFCHRYLIKHAIYNAAWLHGWHALYTLGWRGIFKPREIWRLRGCLINRHQYGPVIGVVGPRQVYICDICLGYKKES